MGTLEEKVALITGGASGIGAATVRLFVDQSTFVNGHTLVVDLIGGRKWSDAPITRMDLKSDPND